MWVKLDDHFVDHPKIVAVGPLGLALFVAGLCYSNRLLTDGFIPEKQVDRLLSNVNGTRHNDTKTVTVNLCKNGLWQRAIVNRTKGFVIHDFLKYQPSRRRILRARKKTATRLARWRGRGNGQ